MKLGSLSGFLLIFFLFSSVYAIDNDFSTADSKIEACVQALKQVSATPESHIPKQLLQRTRGLGIFPGIINIGALVGIELGKGVILRHDENSGVWTNPAFFTFRSGSLGFQLGAQSVDLFLLFMDEVAIQRLLEEHLILGVDASISAGPIGRDRSFDTNLRLESEIFSYSKARGLFLGLSLTGGIIQPDNKANESFHGKNVSVQDILYDNAGVQSENSRSLLETVKSITR
ncbi:MAG: lipid-binding SYLF domain-containing protein [Pseudomonadota bacterium]